MRLKIWYVSLKIEESLRRSVAMARTVFEKICKIDPELWWSTYDFGNRKTFHFALFVRKYDVTFRPSRMSRMSESRYYDIRLILVFMKTKSNLYDRPNSIFLFESLILFILKKILNHFVPISLRRAFCTYLILWLIFFRLQLITAILRKKRADIN